MKFSISLPTGFEGVMYPIPFVEPGDFELMIGASSADISLRASVGVNGTTRHLGRHWRMESAVSVAAL